MNKIISDALKYYDENIAKYASKIKNVHSTTIDENNIMNFINIEKKILFSSNVQIIGAFNTTKNIWIWGWCMSNKPKEIIYLSRKILLYGIDIEYNNNELSVLKNELITSHIKISNKTQLDIYCALALYLTKTTCVYISNENISNNNIQIIYFVLNPPDIN
jgi:hypothetical protein